MEAPDPEQTIRVLVVDDEPDFAETTAAFLRRSVGPIEVETVHSAAAGLDRLQEDRFDCVISDYSMPEQDGLEFLDALRESDPELPFILFTGKGSEEIASQAISAGVTDYLQKTGSTEQYERLANRIRHATSAQQAARAAEATRAQLESIVQSAEDVVLTIDSSSRIQFVNGAIERVFGYPPEAVLGEPLTMLMPERFHDRHEAGLRRYLEQGERQLDWAGVEFQGRHRDGHEVPLSVSFGEFTRNGDRYFTGILRDITDRRRREERLAGINQLLADFQTADEPETICDLAVEAAVNQLELPVTLVALFDSDASTLRSVARTPAASEALDEAELFDSDGGPAWDVFAEGRPTVLDEADGGVANIPEDSRLFLQPLGRHGVFVTAVAESDGVSGHTADVIETVAGAIRGGLDRVQREATLRDREARLEEQNTRLDQLNRLNDVIRRIDRGLVAASSRPVIERTVCEELVAAGPYQFAWIGSYDSVDDRVETHEWAPDDPVLLDESGLDDADHPAVRAATTREPVVVDDILGEPPLADWRRAALDQDFRSCMAVPLRYRDRTYGVLMVYSDRSETFDELEQSVLEEFGATIGYAINAVESTRALVSEAVVELEFELPTDAMAAFETLAFPPETEFELEGLVPIDDGSYRVYFTLQQAPADVLQRFERTEGIQSCSRIAEWEGVSLFECEVVETSFAAWLVDHGAVPRSFEVDDVARLTVELDDEADVRGFVELFQESYPGAELVARRERERPVRTRETFLSDLHSKLTDRQLEVLQTAFLSGFFETPRRRTGEETAAALGISQPTFSDHLRAGLRKLLGLVFTEDVTDSRD